jgi:hypothetical protein
MEITLMDNSETIITVDQKTIDAMKIGYVFLQYN